VAWGIMKMWTRTWIPLNLKFLTSKVKMIPFAVGEKCGFDF
jgi:hypothetical protein